MKNLLYTAALGLLIVGCSKPTIEDEGFDTTPLITNDRSQGEESDNSNSNTASGTADNQAPTGTPTQTTNSSGITVVGDISNVPANTASVVLVEIFDDGKGNIINTYEIVQRENQRVAHVHTLNAAGQRIQTEYGWREFTRFTVAPGESFEVSIIDVESILHRGIQIYKDVNLSIDLNELDRAMDFAGDHWVAQRITVVSFLDSNLGLASGLEFFVGVTHQGHGFNTHTLLHENAHNLDFNNNEYGRALNQEIYELLPASFTLSGFPYVEFKAEVFAWYYLMRDEIPTFVVEILDYFLG